MIGHMTSSVPCKDSREEGKLVFLLYLDHSTTFERRFIKFPFCPSPDFTVHKLPFSFVLNPQAIFSIRITMG